MIIRRPRILLICAGIVLTFLAAWSLRYFSGVEPLMALSKNYTKPGLGQIGLQAGVALVIGHERGHRLWRMSARTMTFSRDRRSLTVDGIRQGILYDSHERPLVSLTAGHAVWQTPFGALNFSNAGTLRMDRGVLATILIPERPLLQSQAVVWDSEHTQVVSPGPLSAAIPRLTVSAGSGTYSLPAVPPTFRRNTGGTGGTLRLSSGVHALFQSRNGPATLDCPGLDWDSASDMASSRGLVTARIPGGLGTASAADASANTRTGDLSGHGFQGTLLLSTEAQ